MKKEETAKLLIGGRTSIEWTVSQLTRARGPLVYLFWRNGQPIYIGASRNGLVRPLSPAHHKGFTRKQSDRFQFVCCDTEREALLLEQQLIQLWKPRFNEIDVAAESEKPMSALRKIVEVDFLRKNANVKDSA